MLQMALAFIIVAGLVYYMLKQTGYVEGLEDKKTGTPNTTTTTTMKERKVNNM